MTPDASARLEYANEFIYNFLIHPDDGLEFEPPLAPALVEARGRFLDRIRAVADAVDPCTVAVFSTNDAGYLEAIGTGLLVLVNSSRYLLTAAHVLDECDHGVFLPGEGLRGQPLTGNSTVTALKSGQDRSQDPIDLGCVRLAEEEIERLGHDRFVDLDRAIDDAPEEAFIAGVASGYPVRDQSIDHRDRLVETASTAFTTGFVGERGYRLAKVDPRPHILLEFSTTLPRS